MVSLQLLLTLLGIIYSVQSASVYNNSRATFHNPIADFAWPDPFTHRHHDGFYYMPRSEENGIALYRSPVLTNWRNAERSLVYRAPNGLDGLWAPEIHWLDGNFYMYFALQTGGNNANHRSYVIKANDPNNPMWGGWSGEVRLSPAGGEDYWSIDGTVLKYDNGRLYFIWSGWPQIDSGFPQNLYIALMCDPMRICGGRVMIKTPEYNWERNGEPLIEGPQIIQHAGRTFVVYSASGSWTADYCLGFMGIDGGADPLNPNNWWRHNQPVFWRHDEAGVYGVGHASFTISPDGREPWIVYHGMSSPNAGWEGRTARVQKYGWNPDNSPAFPRPTGFGTPLETPSGQ